jgi:hypothetical protein
MLTAININETKPYVSKLDPDKTNPTTFHIGVLDGFSRSYIDDQSTSFEFSSKNPNDLVNTSINSGKRRLLAVKFGLRGIDNLMDPQTKKPVLFDTISMSVNKSNYNVVTDSVLKLIPSPIIDEIAAVILEENKFSEEERKN